MNKKEKNVPDFHRASGHQSKAMRKVLMDGKSLTLDDLWAAARGEVQAVLTLEAKARVEESRRLIESMIASGAVMYGINTGFGRFAEIGIPTEKLKELQLNLILSHAVGTGPLLEEDAVRAVLLLKANALASGYSGVRPVVIDTLLAMLNAGVLPEIPSRGSVGASGDLAPLAHMTLVMIGRGHVMGRRRMSGKKALQDAGIPALEPESKEGLALLNGTQVMTAVGAIALEAAIRLYRSADVIGGISLEALSGSLDPFDSRIHEARGHAGQKTSAANLRALLEGSAIIAKRPVRRVQEPYSLRCMPQVHGAGRDVLAYVRSVLETEINGATDNPLVFAGQKKVISGGNFHGEPLALCLDALGMAVSSLAGISERRIAALMDSHASGLPGFLSPGEGIHSGFMIAHVTAAALVSENKVLAHPASVDSIPTSANQEDYVSMGMTSALKALDIVRNAERVLAVELLCAAQGVHLRLPLTPGRAVVSVLAEFHKGVGPLTQDRFLAPDIEEAHAFIRSGRLLEALPDTDRIK